MRTLIAIAARDRRELVEPCLRSVAAAFGDRLGTDGDCHLVLHLDPLTTQYTGAELRAWGASSVVRLELPHDMPAKERIARMRCDAAQMAAGFGFDRILFLDSDVVVSRELPAALDAIWPWLGAASCRAVALGNLALYERPGFLIGRYLEGEYPATVRTHALGSCFAFPVDAYLTEWAANPPCTSWDTHASTHVARNRILTSDVSYVRHDGRHSGLCMRAHPGLDYHNFATDLVLP